MTENILRQNKNSLRRKIVQWGVGVTVAGDKCLQKSNRSWNIHFDDSIKSFDFSQNMDEPCVYRKVGGSTITFLNFYLHHMLLTGNGVGAMSSMKTS